MDKLITAFKESSDIGTPFPTCTEKAKRYRATTIYKPSIRFIFSATFTILIDHRTCPSQTLTSSNNCTPQTNAHWGYRALPNDDTNWQCTFQPIRHNRSSMRTPNITNWEHGAAHGKYLPLISIHPDQSIGLVVECVLQWNHDALKPYPLSTVAVLHLWTWFGADVSCYFRYIQII